MNKNNLTFALQTIPFMPYDQSNTLKYSLCNSSSPLSRGGGEVSECICSKLGGGLERTIVPVDSPVVAIEGPYATRAGELQDMVLRNMDCVNINSEYTTIDSHFSIIDDLKIVNNQENDLYFYHSDHLGSSSFITDADGIVSQHLQYLPYGELFAEQRDNTARYYTPYKFSGKEKDEETGYSYFGARYYMPELSIWSTVDPMADDYPGMSAYMYCAGNPVILKDPDGKKIVDANGNIIYTQKGGWAKNAPASAVRLGNAMMKTRAGREQWNKMVKSKTNIQIEISQAPVKNGNKYTLGQMVPGKTKLTANGKVQLVDAKVIIYEGSINEYYEACKNSNDDFSKSFRTNTDNTDQRIGAVGGHEAEHLTQENLQQNYQNQTKGTSFDLEKKPLEVEMKILEETGMNNIQRLEPRLDNIEVK